MWYSVMKGIIGILHQTQVESHHQTGLVISRTSENVGANGIGHLMAHINVKSASVLSKKV